MGTNLQPAALFAARAVRAVLLLACCTVLLSPSGGGFVVQASQRRALLAPWQTSFPPYGCDRRPTSSPYKLESNFTETPLAGGGSRVCFTVSELQPCNKKNPCCATDFEKLEFDVNVRCAASIKSVTVNGKGGYPAPTFNRYDGNTKAVYKLTSLKLNRRNAPETEICMVLDGRCNTLEELCVGGEVCKYATVESGTCKCCPVNKLGQAPPPPPSPPPPSPPSSPLTPSATPPPGGPFPFCECAQRFGSLPFAIPLSSVPTLTRRGGGNREYCWTLQAFNCTGSACKPGTRVSKIEWWMNNRCRHGTVASVSVDGIKHSYIWADKTFRINLPAFNGRQIESDPKEVCIELRSGGRCPSLEEFCTYKAGITAPSCTIAVFDASKKICPTATYANADDAP